MKLCMQAKQLYPTLISGYDLVGPEDHGRTLHSLTPVLVWFRSELRRQNLTIPFFLHAGECVGDGDSTDQNLYDAILLKTRRIGHAFSLYKHPLLIDMVKERGIVVECCPISNEVLRYTASIKMHPLPALLARGVKAAIANDDPSMMGQGTAGLAHDFWQALQGWDKFGLAGLVSALLLLLLFPCLLLITCGLMMRVCRARSRKIVFVGQHMKIRQTRSGWTILLKEPRGRAFVLRGSESGILSGRSSVNGLWRSLGMWSHSDVYSSIRVGVSFIADP